MIYPEGIQMPYSISKKIILARAVVRKPSLLILNDPLDQLDPVEEDRIMNFLFSKENTWSIIVTSRGKRWENYCDKIINLNNGKIIPNS